MNRFLPAAARAWAVIGGMILLSIVAVTAMNVASFALDRVARLVGGEVGALPGYEDYVSLAVGSAIPMFLPWCQVQRGHLAVDLFIDRMPEKMKSGVDRLSLVLMAGMALFLAYWMTLGLFETRDDGALSPVLGWQVWPFYGAGIGSLILWAMVALGQALTRAPSSFKAAPHA